MCFEGQSDIMSPGHIDPAATTWMFFREFSQIIDFVITNPERLIKTPKAHVSFGHLAQPDFSTSLEPSCFEGSLCDWHLFL